MGRKILFLHVHKSGGTSFVALAKRNCRLAPIHANGNPQDEDGNLIAFWEWGEAEQAAYFARDDQDFVAREGPLLGLRALPGVDRVVIARDPFDRFISHYRQLYVRGRGYRDVGPDTEDAVLAQRHDHKMFDNFLTRQLLAHVPERVGPAEAAEAAATLESFRFVFALPHLERDVSAMRALGWHDFALAREAVHAPEGYDALRASCPRLFAAFEEWNHFDRALFERIAAGRNGALAA
ncbi:MAG: sulfotransferase family 2 domain-containing protein [Pseudomonadota bacterium]